MLQAKNKGNYSLLIENVKQIFKKIIQPIVKKFILYIKKYNNNFMF